MFRSKHSFRWISLQWMICAAATQRDFGVRHLNQLRQLPRWRVVRRCMRWAMLGIGSTPGSIISSNSVLAVKIKRPVWYTLYHHWPVVEKGQQTLLLINQGEKNMSLIASMDSMVSGGWSTIPQMVDIEVLDDHDLVLTRTWSHGDPPTFITPGFRLSLKLGFQP